MNSPRRSRLARSLALVCLGACSLLKAQRPSAPAAAVDPGKDTVLLDAFKVSGSPTVGYRADKTVSGTLIATDMMSLPASVQVITGDLIADMGTQRVEDSIRFVSGVGLSARNEGGNGGTRAENFVIRGFATSQLLRNGIRMQGITNAANLDRIEVLKGPSSIFFGAADPGGVVNYITKQPVPRRFGEVQVGYGDNNYKYAQVDLNEPVVPNKVGLRLMGSWLDSDGWQKFWHDRQLFLNGVLAWHITPTTRVTFDTQYRKQTGIQERMGTVFLTTDGDAPFAQRLLTGAARQRSLELGILTPTDTYNEKGTFNAINVVQKLGDHVVVTGDYGMADGNRLQRTTVTPNRIAVRDNYSYFDRPGLVTIGAINRTLNLKALISYNFRDITNKLVVGWDRSETANKEVYFAYANNSPYTTKRFLFDVADEATTYRVIRYPTLEEFGVAGGPAAVINNPWNKPVWQQGFYVTDQVNLFHDRLNLIGGVRWSDLRAQGKTTWTPQFGASYSVIKPLSIYGLYSESFKPNGRASTIDPDAPFFAPEKGEGKEVGIKLSILEDQLTGTVAFFQVDKHNVRRVDSGAVVQGRNGATLTDGERSDGVEVDLVWTPTRQLSIIAAYSHTDARVVSDIINPATAPDLNNDGVPDTIGMPLPGTSPNSYSLWTKYGFTSGALNGFSINVGYQRREGPIPLDASFARRLVTQGTYDRTDVVLTYAIKVQHQPVRLQLNVNNLQDHVYADRYLGYADPRIIRFSVSTKF
jgi:iron complex outermembrane receptor protein